VKISHPPLAPTLVILLIGLLPAPAPASPQEPTGEPVATGSSSAEEPDPVARIEALVAEIERLRPEVDAAEGDLRRILRRRLSIKRLALAEEVHAFAESAAERSEAGEDVASDRDQARAALTSLTVLIQEHCLDLESELLDQASEAASLSGDERAIVDRRLVIGSGQLTRVYQLLLTHADDLDRLDLDSSQVRDFVSGRLIERAENLTARTQLAIEEARMHQERLEQNPQDSGIQALLRAAEQGLRDTTGVLTGTVELMEGIGLTTASYRQVLVSATGQISPDILDAEVAAGLVERWIENLGEWAAEKGPTWIWRVALFAVVLLATKVVARLLARVLRRATERSKLNLSQLLQRMIVNVATQAVWALGILFALAQLGVSLGPLLAGLGIAGFVVGFALQDTLGNFAAGVMILIYRPYDVGDLIEAGGVFGTVHRMNLVSTTILTIDNQTLVIPNGKIWGDVIKNVTAQTQRRIDMTFGISYTDDIPKAEKILESILADHPKVLDDPEPMVRLHNLGESSVDFAVRPWVETDDYWDVYWDVTREVKMRFDGEGVSIPFPQRDVHLFTQEAPAA
jgi:small conductance mechanosensitive channel